MRTDEVIIRIINEIDIVYGDKINQQEIKQIIENVLYDYDVSTKITALVPMNDMQDKMKLYLMAKKLEGIRPNTVLNYGRTLRKFSESYTINVEDITTMDIRRYLAMYMQRGVKNNTIVNITDILRGFFNWLHREEYITKNPMDKVKTIKKEESTREPLTHEELEILYGGCESLRQSAMLSFFVATGCRLEEVEKLNKVDIDWINSKTQVTGKGGKTRTVLINAKAKVQLRKYLNSRNDDSEALFVTERQPIQRLGRRAIQREVGKIRDQSGLKKNVFVHLLRHTYGTNGISSGMNITSIQKLMGHSNLSTTQIYAKTSTASIEYEYNKCMNG